MTQQTINVGTVANDGTGDSHRAAFIKANDNFTELYALVAAASPAAAGTLTGATLAANVLASSLTSVGTLASLAVTGVVTLGGDQYLRRAAAATLALGAADAASPVAQTLSVQSVVAGTSNTAGANLTIAGSKGTGTGAGGSILFQTAPTGTTGTSQNALVTRMGISGAGLVSITGVGAAGTSTFRVNAGSGNAYFQVNDNGTIVIDGDVSTGVNPLTVKYNGGTVATISYTGTVSGVAIVSGSNPGLGGLFLGGDYARVTTAGDGRLLLQTAFTLGISLQPGAGNSGTVTHGESLNVKALSELTSIAAAATTDTAILLPANAIIIAVVVRVTTAVTCTSTFTVGDAGSAARFSTAAVSKASGSTDPGTKAGAYFNTAATAVRITPDTVPSDATGRVRVTIYYIDATPPTS